MDPLVTTALAGGTAVLAAAAFHASFSVYGVVRRVRAERSRSGLELDILRQRVGAATAAAEFARERARTTWSEYRKFRLDRVEPEAAGIRSFYFVPHDGKSLPRYEPGQHITIRILPAGERNPVVRCYTLSGDPDNQDFYRISVKRVMPPRDAADAPPGRMSVQLLDTVKPGDLVDLRPPGGVFTLDPESLQPAVFLAGGVGITPFLAMLESAARIGGEREIWLFYGVRNGREHAFRDYLKTFTEKLPHFHLVNCYSNPDEGDAESGDCTVGGRVTGELLREMLPSLNYAFYMCAPPPMIDALRESLGTAGVPSEFLIHEAFGAAGAKKVSGEGQFKVSFSRANKDVSWTPAAGSLLDFAEANDIAIDSGCRAGQCGTCAVAVRSGEFSYLGPISAQPEAGSCLACLAVPKTDLELEA